MEEASDYKAALVSIHEGFEIEEEQSEDYLTREQLLAHLEQVVTDHLTTSPERLHLALYRMDVNEQQFRIALSGPTPASSVAILILDRELKKVKTRKIYPPNWEDIPEEDRL